MAAEQFNASVLVNHGLQATAFLNQMDFGITPSAITNVATQTVSDDVLASFRDIVSDPKVQLIAPDLVGIFGTFASTSDLATWAINAKYADAGGADGVLGRTIGAVTSTPNKAGFLRSFQAGVIYWHPNTGAHALHGPILTRWRELGAETGFLGFPSSDVTQGTDVRAEGFFAHFQGGSIYWSPPSHFGGVITGVSVAGMALGALAAMASTPATPVNPAGPANLSAASFNTSTVVLSSLELHTLALDHAASAQTHENSGGTTATLDHGAAALSGRVHVELHDGIDLNRALQSSAGAFEVHGAIREKYLALGAEASILGYPRTDESGTPDGRGRFNHFEGGSIYWTAGTSAHEVHGLIRDRWSALGWERNPQLGYPISDELIPDPRVGHRRPEVIKKPIASLPAGVIKLPAAASAAGFPASVVNTPLPQGAAVEARVALPFAETTTADAAARATSLAALVRPQSGGALGALSSQASTSGTLTANATSITDMHVGDLLSHEATFNVTLDPAIIGMLREPASTPGQRSVNRFADFESGVLFWFRGATSASVLTPLSATSDGTSLAFSGNDIAALAVARLGRSMLEFANAQLLSMSFVGTTPYSHDSVQVHNRRHRLQLVLQGVENQTLSGPLGLQFPQTVPVTASVELQVEVWFDAVQRRIALALVDWSMLQASTQTYAAAVEAGLRSRLDLLLWQSFELMTLPDTDGGAAMAVLSVKTLTNGAVVVFVEPRHLNLLQGIGDLANTVATTVIQFAHQN